MKKFGLFAGLFVFLGVVAWGQATFYWRGTGNSGNWGGFTDSDGTQRNEWSIISPTGATVNLDFPGKNERPGDTAVFSASTTAVALNFGNINNSDRLIGNLLTLDGLEIRRPVTFRMMNWQYRPLNDIYVNHLILTNNLTVINQATGNNPPDDYLKSANIHINNLTVTGAGQFTPNPAPSTSDFVAALKMDGANVSVTASAITITIPVDLGIVNIGEINTDRNVTIYNLGHAVVNIKGISTTGVITLQNGPSSGGDFIIQGLISGERLIIDAPDGTVEIADNVTVTVTSTLDCSSGHGINDSAIYVNADVFKAQGSSVNIIPGSTGVGVLCYTTGVDRLNISRVESARICSLSPHGTPTSNVFIWTGVVPDGDWDNELGWYTTTTPFPVGGPGSGANVIIEAGKVNLVSAISINSLELYADTTLNANNNSITSSSGLFNRGIIQLGSGNLSVTGGINNNSGTIQLTGATAQTITGIPATGIGGTIIYDVGTSSSFKFGSTYNNLIINDSLETITHTGNLTVNGTAKIESSVTTTGGTQTYNGGLTTTNDITLIATNISTGTLTVQSGNLTLESPLTANVVNIQLGSIIAGTSITVTNKWNNYVGASGFTAGSGTVTFITSTIEGTTTFNNVIFKEANSAPGPITISGNLDLVEAKEISGDISFWDGKLRVTSELPIWPDTTMGTNDVIITDFVGTGTNTLTATNKIVEITTVVGTGGTLDIDIGRILSLPVAPSSYETKNTDITLRGNWDLTFSGSPLVENRFRNVVIAAGANITLDAGLYTNNLTINGILNARTNDVELFNGVWIRNPSTGAFNQSPGGRLIFSAVTVTGNNTFPSIVHVNVDENLNETTFEGNNIFNNQLNIVKGTAIFEGSNTFNGAVICDKSIDWDSYLSYENIILKFASGTTQDFGTTGSLNTTGNTGYTTTLTNTGGTDPDADRWKIAGLTEARFFTDSYTRIEWCESVINHLGRNPVTPPPAAGDPAARDGGNNIRVFVLSEYTWVGAHTDNTWAAPANWKDGEIPPNPWVGGKDLTIAKTGAYNPTAPADVTDVGTLTVTNGHLTLSANMTAKNVYINPVIAEDGVLDIQGFDFTITDDVSNAGIVKLHGSTSQSVLFGSPPAPPSPGDRMEGTIWYYNPTLPSTTPIPSKLVLGDSYTNLIIDPYLPMQSIPSLSIEETAEISSDITTDIIELVKSSTKISFKTAVNLTPASASDITFNAPNGGTVAFANVASTAAIIFDGGSSTAPLYVQSNVTPATTPAVVNANVVITDGSYVTVDSGILQQTNGSTLTLGAGAVFDLNGGGWAIGGTGAANTFSGNSGYLNTTGAAKIIARGNVSIAALTVFEFTGTHTEDLIFEMSGNVTKNLSSAQPLYRLHIKDGETRLGSALTINREVIIESPGYLNAGANNVTLNAGYGNVFRWEIDAPQPTSSSDMNSFAFRTSGNVTLTGSAFAVFEIVGHSMWHDFTCTSPEVEIKFSANHHHWFLNTMNISSTGNYIILSRYSTSWPSRYEGDALGVNGTPILGDPSLPVPDMEKFWFFNFVGSTLTLNNVGVYFSYAYSTPIDISKRLSVLRVLPYFLDDGASRTGHFCYRWLEIENKRIMYSFAEDKNGDGIIDRIRAQANAGLNTSSLSGFAAEVRDADGRAVTIIDYLADGGDSFFILLKQEDGQTLYDGRPYSWRIINSSLEDTDGNTIHYDNREIYRTINTIPPRISYALALPGHNEIYVEFSQPVVLYSTDTPFNDSNLGFRSIRPVSSVSRPAYSLDFVASDNSVRSFRIRDGYDYAPPSSGVTGYIIEVDNAPTVGQLEDLNPIGETPDPWFILNGFRNLAVRALDWSDTAIDTDAGFYLPPKYPTNWNYTAYASFVGNGHAAKADGTPLTNDAPGNPTNIFIPPYRVLTPAMVRDLKAGTPVSAPGDFSDNANRRRVTDVLVSLEPETKDSENYFVWPVYAIANNDPDLVPPDPSDPDFDLWGNTTTDQNIIWNFDGSAMLELYDYDGTSITSFDMHIQSKLTSGTPTMYYANGLNIGVQYRNPRTPAELNTARSGGLWLPVTTPGNLSSIVPQYYSSATRTTSFSNINVSTWDSSVFEFFLNNGSSDLLIARLEAPRGTIPSDWYRRVRPFQFGIQNVIRQSGGVTILNNVINSDRREITYLRYRLNRPGRVTIQVYSLDGTVVKSIVRNEQRAARVWRDGWDGTNQSGRPVARGIYYIRITAPDIDEIRKVLVIR